MGLFQALRGLLLCISWYYTIISGFYILYCPVIYVIIFNHKLYRTTVDQLFALWELYPVALFQWCHKMELHYYGDYINANEKAIIIINHRTRVDWNYIWIALYHATQEYVHEKQPIKTTFAENIKQTLVQTLGGKSKIKFVLKDEIKNIPALGWIMQLNYFLYIKRNWQEDEKSITTFLNYYDKIQSSFRLLLFPEGTDFSESNRCRSDRFANDNNLPCYKFVLHPRTTGWATLCSQLLDSGLCAVYDGTVAYDAPPQTETDLLCGRLPRHTYFFFKRYSAEKLPRDEKSLRNWLDQIWLQKEKSLNNFHNKGTFLDYTKNEAPTKRRSRSLAAAKIAFLIWNFVGFIFIYLLIYSSWFQFWIIYHTILLLFGTWYFGGFHILQSKLMQCV